MTTNTRESEMNLNELRKAAQSQPADDFSGEETPVVGGDWMNAPAIQNTQDVPDLGAPTNTMPEKKVEYNGPGIVFTNVEDTEEEVPMKYTGVTPDTQKNVDAYLQEMDNEIEELKKLKEKVAPDNSDSEEEETDDDAEVTKEMTQDEFNRKYSEAIVVIDKTGLGTVIDFTAADREKLDRSKKIRLEEVEDISLDSIKTKKMKKKGDIGNIIKKVNQMHSTNIVVPVSGYTAVMRGCSAHELISLLKGDSNRMTDLQTKWSLIHDKIESTSLGKMTYNEFLLNTATLDMNIFIYGILSATYPDDDYIPLTCKKCGKEFRHPYSIKSLLRAEKIEPKLQDLIMSAVDNSFGDGTAKISHENAPLNSVKRIRLPDSGIITEVYVQSAYDLINKSAKELADDNREAKYESAAILSTAIAKLYIPDPDADDGSYYEVDQVMDIVKTLYSLSSQDDTILTKVVNDMLDGLVMEFGLMNITCPSCKHYTATIPMDIEDILFFKYRQAKTTTVE